MTRDERARQRLVEIALDAADGPIEYNPMRDPFALRLRAGFRDPSKGPWCAAGLTAAMEDAGLVVPEPGTPARRRSIALVDWLVVGNRFEAAIIDRGPPVRAADMFPRFDIKPGDIIAWLQHPIPAGMLQSPAVYQEAAGWRRGHVSVIVAVDEESITTVGWNEGPKPGRVMRRRLWRGGGTCHLCGSSAHHVTRMHGRPICWTSACASMVLTPAPRSATVLWRRPGGLYGIARPVAR